MFDLRQIDRGPHCGVQENILSLLGCVGGAKTWEFRGQIDQTLKKILTASINRAQDRRRHTRDAEHESLRQEAAPSTASAGTKFRAHACDEVSDVAISEGPMAIGCCCVLSGSEVPNVYATYVFALVTFHTVCVLVSDMIDMMPTASSPDQAQWRQSLGRAQPEFVYPCYVHTCSRFRLRRYRMHPSAW